MGSGKTTIGKKLSAFLGSRFIDLDQTLVEKTGVSIAHIFEVEGEEGFRARESRLLQEVSTEYPDSVISTGGGIVLRQENIDIMRQNGLVIFLDVPEKVLWHRLKDCQHRPLLRVNKPRQKLQEIKSERTPMYEAAAHIQLQVESDSAAKSARRIQTSLIQMGTAIDSEIQPQAEQVQR